MTTTARETTWCSRRPLTQGGIGEEGAELEMVQPAGTEPCHLLVEGGDDAGDLALGDPRPTEGRDQVIDLAGADAPDVGLQNLGVESTIDSGGSARR